MMLTLLITSKGIAAVPRASLVVLAGTLSSFGLPLEGVAVILGVDELMDMARTMVNLVGNCLATAVMARWEGELGPVGTATSAALAGAQPPRAEPVQHNRHLTMIAIASLRAAAALARRQPASGRGARPAAGRGTPAPVRSAPVANLRYEVTFDSASAAQRTLKVAMTFDVGGPGPVLLSLPAWTPGAYEIANFARWVAGFTAPPGGKALDWDKLDYDTWRIDPAGARTVTVRFDYRADTLDNAMAWAGPTSRSSTAPTSSPTPRAGASTSPPR